MIHTFIARACTDLPVSACCRVMRVSTSGFYAWQANPVRPKDLDDAYLCDTIVDIWTMSRRSYGSPRVHAELKLGQDVRCSRKRVERLMRQAGSPASIGASDAAARGAISAPSPPTTWSSGPSTPPSPIACG
jgi:putative transposase